jgi:hypothetical protein
MNNNVPPLYIHTKKGVLLNINKIKENKEHIRKYFEDRRNKKQEFFKFTKSDKQTDKTNKQINKKSDEQNMHQSKNEVKSIIKKCRTTVNAKTNANTNSNTNSNTNENVTINFKPEQNFNFEQMKLTKI